MSAGIDEENAEARHLRHARADVWDLSDSNSVRAAATRLAALSPSNSRIKACAALALAAVNNNFSSAL